MNLECFPRKTVGTEWGCPGRVSTYVTNARAVGIRLPKPVTALNIITFPGSWTRCFRI